MKPKTIILMVVAVVCGLVASYMTSQLLASRNNNNSQELEKVSVLVAKKNLEIGISIKEKNAKVLFEPKEFIKGKEPRNALTSYDAIKDKFLKRNLRQGDFVAAEDLVDDFNALTLPDGKRALGIKVNNESSVSGFATLPGNHVDILWSVKGKNLESTQCATLLEDVLVLAADTNSIRNNEQGAIPASVVTVALTPKDARRVTLAQQAGTLRFVLRRADDKTKEKERVTSLDTVFKELFDEPTEEPLPVIVNPQPKSPNYTPLQPYVVEIVTGDRVRHKQYRIDHQGNIVRNGVTYPATQGENDGETRPDQAQPEGGQSPNVQPQPEDGNDDVTPPKRSKQS